MMKSCRERFGLAALLLAAIFLVGCTQPNQEQPSAQAKNDSSDKQSDAGKEGEGHNLHNYWCVEHGIPEAECSMCSAEFAAKCKAKGDWCDKHNRARSQCFICEPKLKEKFAAKYRAKFGKEPPPIEDLQDKE